MANNSIKKDQNRQKELAYMRKIKQTMQPKSTEERQKEIAAEAVAATQTTGNKVANFFYYYKVRIILIAVLVLIAIVVGASFLNRPTYDSRILTVFSADSIEAEKYSNAIAQYGFDLDNNGTIELQMMEVCLSDGQDGNTEASQRASLVAYMQLKDVNLYLLDSNIYEELMGQAPEAFVDLSALYPDNPNIDGRRYLIKGTQLEQEIGVEHLPNEFAFVMRTKDHAGKDEANYDASIKLLENIIKNTKTVTE